MITIEVNTKRINKGFTIIELLLYIFIFGACLTMLSSFVSMVNGAKAKNAIISEVEQQGNEISYVIRQAIIASSGITSPSSGSSSNTLTLTFIDSAKNPTIFSLIGGHVTMKEGSSPAINLNNDRVVASNLIFYNLGKSGTPGNITSGFFLGPAGTTVRSEFFYSKKFNLTASRRN